MRSVPRMRAVLAGTLAVIVLAACGSVAGPAPPPPLKLTEADFGRSVSAAAGQEIDLALTDVRPVPGSALVWTASSDNRAILALVSEKRGPAAPGRNQTYTAVFSARSAGSANILLAGATTCEAMPKPFCPDRTAQIGVTVS